MESREISDGQISASSQFAITHAAFYGRLHGKTRAWSARTTDVNQWLQIDLIGQYRVTRVATQGRDDYNQWVTKYQLQYSNDSMNFLDYKGYGQNATKVRYLRRGNTRSQFSIHLILGFNANISFAFKAIQKPYAHFTKLY